MNNKKKEPNLDIVVTRLDVVVARLDRADDKFEKLVTVVLKNSEDIVVIKEMGIETNKQVGLIVNQLDAFRKSVEVFDKRVLFHSHLHNEANDKIADHEKRITALEKAS